MFFFRSICSSLQDAPACFLFCFPHTTHPCLAMLATVDADAASPEPSESSADEDFWGHVESIFSDLTAEDGVEVGNVFWIGVPEETSEAKLVLQIQGSARLVVRSVRALLREDESPFVGGKLLVNGDVLVILYLRRGAQPDADLLHDVAGSCAAVPFLPYNCTATDPRLIWLGNNERDSLCLPIY